MTSIILTIQILRITENEFTIQWYWDTLAKTSFDEPHGKNANDTSSSISVASNLSLSVRKGLAIRSFEMDSVRTF